MNFQKLKMNDITRHSGTYLQSQHLEEEKEECEFQMSLGYILRPCFKKKEKSHNFS
jgi:hypothetical protein